MRSKVSCLCLIVAAQAAVAGCDEARYTVSGSVSGLVGTGLVLRSGDASSPVDQNGDFQLAGSFTRGAAYDVTVATQPSAPAQVCTVTNGSGVVSSNVVGVTVDCVTTPITVVASTPADAATGVARAVAPSLTFSAALDAATVPGHVAFRRGALVVPATIAATSDTTVSVTPQSPLSLLTTYTVAADPGLLGIYGETTAADTAVRFTTRDGAWHTAETVKLDAPNVSEAHVAFTSDGNAVATWYQYDGPVANVWANIYTVGSGWGTAAVIETSNAGDAVGPRIATDAQGHAFVVWSQSNGARTDIWGARYTVGSGWSPPSQISDSGVGTANQSPMVGAAPSGAVVVTWINTSGADDSVWARAFDATGTASPASRIDFATGSAGTPKMVVDANGSATVIFTNYDASNNTVDLWANRYEGGAWGAGGILDTSAQPISEYSIARDGSGHVFAAWSQQIDGSSQSVNASRYAAATGWGAIATIATTSNSSSYYPEVAADADGNALLLWGQYDASVFHAYSSYFTEAGGWGAPTMLPAGVTAKATFDGSGNALAVWNEEASATSRVVRSSRFTVGGGWETPILLTPGAAAYSQYPKLAVDAHGEALCVWVDYDIANNRQNIAASRFDDAP